MGNLVEMIAEGQETATSRWAQEYGPIFCFMLGAVPVVMIDDADLARKVLVLPSRHHIFSLHSGEEEQFEQQNLVFINGEKWKVTRNSWQPFFSKDSISLHGKFIGQSTGRLSGHLGSAADTGAEVDIWRAVGRLTLDVVGSVAFGVDFNTLDHSQDERPMTSSPTTADRLIWAAVTFFQQFGLSNWYFGLFFLFPHLQSQVKWCANTFPNAAFKKEVAARTEMRVVGTELVRQAREAGTGGKERPTVVQPGSFLSLILPSAAKTTAMHDTSLADLWAASQATTFILAGYETTANTIAYAIYLLSLYQDKEAKLLAEVDAFGRDQLPTAEQLEQGAFPFTQAVIQEALRLYPPAGTAVRESKEGMVVGGYAIPPRSALQVSIYSMHRNERFWQEPLAFKPERFLPGTPEAQQSNLAAHIPFGDGVRKCIGYKFALLETALALIKLYQQYYFRLLPGQVPLKVRTLLTMSPLEGVRVTVHRRTQIVAG